MVVVDKINWPTLVLAVTVSVFLFSWLKYDINSLRDDIKEIKQLMIQRITQRNVTQANAKL